MFDNHKLTHAHWWLIIASLCVLMAMGYQLWHFWQPVVIYQQLSPALVDAQKITKSLYILPLSANTRIQQRLWLPTKAIDSVQFFITSPTTIVHAPPLTLHRDTNNQPDSVFGTLSGTVTPQSNSIYMLEYELPDSIKPTTWVWVAWTGSADQPTIRFLRENDSSQYPGGQLLTQTNQTTKPVAGILAFNLVDRTVAPWAIHQTIPVLLISLWVLILAIGWIDTPRSSPA